MSRNSTHLLTEDQPLAICPECQFEEGEHSLTCKRNTMSLIDFIKTKRSKEDLKIALEVLTEFKSNESHEEWALTPFMAWAKLEQLEEYLEHLVNDAPLNE